MIVRVRRRNDEQREFRAPCPDAKISWVTISDISAFCIDSWLFEVRMCEWRCRRHASWIILEERRRAKARLRSRSARTVGGGQRAHRKMQAMCVL